MTQAKKAFKKPELVECVAVRNLCCDYQVKAGNSFTCTQAQYDYFESVGAAVKKVKAV
jgi:hypothetical protein